MQENAFIVAEYNPFHNGHAYHIQKTRQAGAENIICIMSGNFVQRGTPAVFDKTIRAKAAIAGGADLVIELPLKYAVSGAGDFAVGALKMIESMSLNGTLSFGASTDLSVLNQIVDIILKAESSGLINDIIKNDGSNFASATVLCLKKANVNTEVLNDANNVLGVEYLKALRECHGRLDAFIVDRAMCRHDTEIPFQNMISANALRTSLFDNKKYALDFWKSFCSEENLLTYCNSLDAGNSVSCHNNFNIAVSARLAGKTAEELLQYNGVNQGLENRFEQGIRNTNGFFDLCDYIKTKRFTHSRIRRMVLSACLGITKEDVSSNPSYIRVLAFNDKGRKILNNVKNVASIPIITNISQIAKENDFAFQDAQKDCLAAKFYELCKDVPQYINPEYKVKPYSKNSD